MPADLPRPGDAYLNALGIAELIDPVDTDNLGQRIALAQVYATLAVADAIGQHDADSEERAAKLRIRLDKVVAQIRGTR